MMQSTMQDLPLNVGMIFRHGRALHGESEVVTFEGDASRHASFADVSARVDRLAAALGELGIESGDRVGTFMWNTQEHLEAYFAVPCMGAVLHTLNIRLFAEQLAYIVNHADDRVVLVDDNLVPVLARVAAELKTVERYVVVGDGDYGDARGRRSRRRVPPLRGAPRARRRRRPRVPGGRRARRRGDVLHERHHRQPEGRRLLAPVDVPALDRHPDRHRGAVHVERPRAADRADVPRQRVGHAVRGVDGRRRPADAGPLPAGRAARHVHRHASGPPPRARCPPSGPTSSATRRATRSTSRRCERIMCGGSAVPRALMEAFEERFGIRILQGWGMTETSPLAAVSIPPRGVEPGTPEEMDWRSLTGRVAARRRAAHRRRRRRGAAVGRRGGRRDRGARPVDHRVRTTATPRPRSSTTAGCAPATSAASHPTATSRSPTARRTSSSRAASGSRRSSSKAI